MVFSIQLSPGSDALSSLKCTRSIKMLLHSLQHFRLGELLHSTLTRLYFEKVVRVVSASV